MNISVAKGRRAAARLCEALDRLRAMMKLSLTPLDDCGCLLEPEHSLDSEQTRQAIVRADKAFE